MATVIYRCPVSPDCPTSTSRGYCAIHFSERLEPVQDGPGPEAAAASPAPGPSATVPGSSGTASPPTRVRRPAAAGQPGTARLALMFLGTLLPVPEAGMGIGRDEPDCAGVPGLAEHTQLSRHHARLRWIDGTLHVEDAGSTNGTHVDGKAISLPTPVWPGRALRFAEDIEVAVVELDMYGSPC